MSSPRPPDLSRVMAPMINLSDLAFRALVAEMGATAVYTQMLLEDDVLSPTPDAEEGQDPWHHHTCTCVRHPALQKIATIVQLAGHDPEKLARATRMVLFRPGIAAVDLNLGCPQEGAKEGLYGSFLADECHWPLVGRIVTSMSEAARECGGKPFIVKCRLQPTLGGTLRFVDLVRSTSGGGSGGGADAGAGAGSSALVVHGRQRGSTQHRRAGLADLDAIKAVVEHVAASPSPFPFPVVSNGNVCCHEDVHANRKVTGAVGVMSAEALLRDPSLFDCKQHDCCCCSSGSGGDDEGAGVSPPYPHHHHHHHRSSIADHCCLKQREVIPPPFLPCHSFATKEQLQRLLRDAKRAARVITRYLELVSLFHSTAEPHDCLLPSSRCKEAFAAAAHCLPPCCEALGCLQLLGTGDFVSTPGLTLDKLLLHVQWMLGRYGGGHNVQYRFRGKYKPQEIKNELLSAEGVQAALLTSCAAACKAPVLHLIKRRAVDEIVGSAIAMAEAELAKREEGAEVGR